MLLLTCVASASFFRNYKIERELKILFISQQIQLLTLVYTLRQAITAFSNILITFIALTWV